MKFSEKMCLMIIIKVTKKQSFTLSSEDTFLKKKNTGRGQIDLLPPITHTHTHIHKHTNTRFRVNLIRSNDFEHDFENSLYYHYITFTF